MTIKEVEQYLEVPRATIRFYEKEGLIHPDRSGNGYRDYSEADMEQLRKIIIFRKLGMSLPDIVDVLDGAKPLSQAVAENIVNLEKQIEELKGALFVCHKLQEEKEEMETFQVQKYWSVIEEEEEKGNRFLDIAKDMVHFEKSIILEYFDIADTEGNLAVSIPRAILSVMGVTILFGVVHCILEGEWTRQNMLIGLQTMFNMIVMELIVGILIFFMGRKHPEVLIKRNRNKIMFWFFSGLALLCILLIFLSMFFGW